MEPEGQLAAPDPPALDIDAPLTRYRALQVISILLVLGGIAAFVVAVVIRAGRPDAELPIDASLAVAALAVGGALAAVVGLLMNAVRAIVVREALPPQRYRGPAVFVLLALASIFTVIETVTVAGSTLALVSGGAISVPATLVIFTATQTGLLAVAILFVAVPSGLAGVRLVPPRGALRSFVIGLGFAIPAWLGATVLGALLQVILERLGHPPVPGILDDAIARLDPTALVLAVVLVAPVAEEIFFRGLVLNAWLREYGERFAIVGSAALFGAIHADTSSVEALITSVARVLPIFGLGLALAFVYRRTGSLLAAIGLHMGFNALSIAIALAQRLGLMPQF
ncbi:MAG TPA: type II CAAX endopeptidase family protein [Candidatus Limnocylindria bacterium]